MDSANLALALRQYIADAAPGGALNPEISPSSAGTLAKALLGLLPGIGDVISGYDAVEAAVGGRYGEAALNGLGVLPAIPSMGGAMGIIRDIRKPAWNGRSGQSIPVGIQPTPAEMRELLRDEQATDGTLRVLRDSSSGATYAWPAGAALHQDIGHFFGVRPANAEHGLFTR